MAYNDVFNVNKSDYETPNLLMGQKLGLVDTINKQHPKIWANYKQMKSMDWDENDFDFSNCNNEFKTCDRSTYNMMIRTIAWQWEADSMVAHTIAPVAANFVTSDELWAAWLEITANEQVHSLTYSEMVRNSFDNPSEVIADIMSINESIKRLDGVGTLLNKIYTKSHEYALGLVPNDQETYNHAFLLPIALLYMERGEFIASFAVTFAVANTGYFQQIGKAVQRIAQDELEIHSELDKLVITQELTTERGKIAYEQTKELATNVLDEVLMNELNWVDFLFSSGDELVGLTPELLKEWTAFNFNVIYNFMGYTPGAEVLALLGGSLPTKNPLKFMEKWLDMSKLQPSPQEENHGQYLVNVVQRNDTGLVFDTDF